MHLRIFQLNLMTVDCVWSSWFPGRCSKSCGGGERINTRFKKVVEKHGGSCSGNFNVTDTCHTNLCPGMRNN